MISFLITFLLQSIINFTKQWKITLNYCQYLPVYIWGLSYSYLWTIQTFNDVFYDFSRYQNFFSKDSIHAIFAIFTFDQFFLLFCLIFQGALLYNFLYLSLDYLEILLLFMIICFVFVFCPYFLIIYLYFNLNK